VFWVAGAGVVWDLPSFVVDCTCSKPRNFMMMDDDERLLQA
jgi:hypothetical protein